MISRRRVVAASIRSSAKSIALFAAAVIVAAQFLALAHIHQRNPTRLLNAQSQVVADDSLCALCLLAFHAPINPAVAPAVERPYAEIRLLNAATARLHLSASYSSCRTRAPPAALA